MNENIKIERLMKVLPYEILVQYSSGTDNSDVFLENMNKIAEEDGTDVLNVMLWAAQETLYTYDSELLSHLNYEMKFEHPDEWTAERKEITAFIRKVKSYIK